MTLDMPVPEPAQKWLDSLDEGILWLDDSRSVLGWNHSAKVFFSAAPDDLPTPPCRLEDLLTMEEGLLPSLLAGDVEALEATLNRPGGAIFVWMSLDPVKLEGFPCGWLLTLKRRIQVDEEVTRFLGFLAIFLHAFKNPLASIKLLAQAAQLELSVNQDVNGLRNRLMGYLQRADSEVDRILEQLESVRYLSGIPGSRYSWFAVKPLAQSVLSRYSRALERLNIGHELTVEDTQDKFYGNPDDLLQLFTNLVVRAQEAMKAGGGTLALKISVLHNELVIDALDNGALIREEELERLSKRTFLSSRGNLPLCVVGWIVDRYRGHITCESEKDRGTSIRIRLPCQTSGGPGGGT